MSAIPASRDRTERDKAAKAAKAKTDGVIGQAQQYAVAYAQEQNEAAKQQLVVRVAEAYFNVLAAEDNLASTEAAREAIVQYNIIFDSEEHQRIWYGFLRYLRRLYPDSKTVSQRIISPQELQGAQQDVASYRKFDLLCREFEQLTEKLGELERQTSDLTEEKKRRRSPSNRVWK